jgi:Flp pilus assembly pilin Flp
MNNLLIKMYVKFQELKDREDGQYLVEYALVIVLVSIAAVASLGTLAGKITGVFSTIGADL